MLRTAIAATLCSLVQAACLGQAPSALPEGWENITEKLWAQIPEYEHDPQWYNRRVGTIHVDNTRGDLYVTLCTKWGTYKSSDCGETWAHVDSTALGRQVENRGISVNPITGDFVLFKVNGGPPTQGAIVLDHGGKWLPIPSKIGDGFRCGMADWSQDPPTTLLAIRHHHDGLYLTQDGGQTWTELPRNDGYGAAMLDANTIFLAYIKPTEGYDRKAKVAKFKARSMIKEIMLTTDQCKTFTKVGEFNPRCETPTRYGDDLYWIAAEGVMVTRDRGRSWQLMGRPLADIVYGPYFGADKDTMVVVTQKAFYRTTDAGNTWTKLSDVITPQGGKLELAHPGWDPIHNMLYIGFLGGDVHRYRLPKQWTTSACPGELG